MKLNELTKIKLAKSKKTLGRGHGSGKGKTAGRGTKGQKARENVRLGFIGGASTTRYIKRLPFRRGVGNKAGSNTLGITLSDLSSLPKGSTVSADTLVQNGLASLGQLRRRPVKVLGTGELTVALTIEIPATPGAIKKIEAAGGKVLSNS